MDEGTFFDFDSQEYREFLNDDDFISNDPIIQTCEEAQAPTLFPLTFNCKGESYGHFSNNEFLKDLNDMFNNSSMISFKNELSIFNFNIDCRNNYDILIQLARLNVQQISVSQLDNTDRKMLKSFYSMRNDVTKLLLILRCKYQHLKENHVNMLRVMLGTFDSMPNFLSVHMAYSSEGNESTYANYHLLHLMLECRWIYLTLIYKIDYFNGHIGEEDCEFSTEVKLLMFDLIMLSVSKFQKLSSSTNLSNLSPFICSCVRDVWKLLHTCMDKMYDQNTGFWRLLSTILNEIANGRSFYAKFKSKRILLRNSQFIATKNHDQFAIWLMTGIFKIFDNNEISNNIQGYEIFENLLRKYLKVDHSEENMRVLLLTIAEILFQTKSETLMIFWEYFQRKINSPFMTIGQNPNSLIISNTTAQSYLEQVRVQQNGPVSKLTINSTSYSIFVYILGIMVKKFTDDHQKVQIQKIFSRIYSKFPPNKLSQLNEMGIYNLLKLFITLSVSAHFADISQKLCDTLLQIPMIKSSHQQQMVKGHVIMLLLHHENRMDVSQYITKIINQINGILQSTSSVSKILKFFEETLSMILLKNLFAHEDLLDNGEDKLLDACIIKILQLSTPAEQDRLYETLTRIIQKVNEIQKYPFAAVKIAVLKEKLFGILLPYANQVFGKIDSVWLAEMAASLCMLGYSSKLAQDTQKAETLFKVCVDSTNVEQSMKFLTFLIKNSEIKDNLDVTLVMRNWIKISVLIGGSNNDLKELTSQMIHLKEFKCLCETSSLKTLEFIESKDRLWIFIADIGRKYSTLNNQQKFQLIDKFHEYFTVAFEKWSLPYIKQQHQDSTLDKGKLSGVSIDESIMRIYSFIAITFLHCSELIYVRSKTLCFFNVAIANFLLPSTLMVGQNPPRTIIVSMHRTWPSILEGLSKLNYKSDQYIGKVINDIIVKWAPYMQISNNSKFVAKPFISITNLKNIETVEYFWGKLASSYVSLQNGRKSNAHSGLILTVFEEVLHVVESDECKTVAAWRNMILKVIECSMLLDEMESTQKTCFGLIERFMRNKHFQNSNKMRDLFINNLKMITEGSLSYHSGLYFRFLSRLTKININIVNSFLPNLLSQIQKVEQLRGTGRDMKLRNFYDQLQAHCIKSTKM